LDLTGLYAYAELSPNWSTTVEGLQSAGKKRSVEDDEEQLMEEGCSAAVAERQGGGEVIGEDSTSKRPKTDNTAGVYNFAAELFAAECESTEKRRVRSRVGLRS